MSVIYIGRICRTISISLLMLAAACDSFGLKRAYTKEERFVKPSDSQISRENDIWRIETIEVPEELIIEIGGILQLPNKRILLTTRRGDIWIVEGAYEEGTAPRFELFASGLHEALGVAAAPNGGYYVVQRQELTLIEDRNGDGRADRFETIYRVPISGNYHEFAFGPSAAPNGDMRISLMLAYNGPAYSPVPWRGWIVDISPDGRMTPVAAGIRAGFGIIWSSNGLCLLTDNQGEWRGTSHVSVLESGDFVGHPRSLVWSHLPGSPVKLRPEDIPDTGEPMHEVAKRVSGIRLPAVWLPYAIHGISPTDIVEDRTGGKFGPFAGQFFVGDSGQSKIIRVSLEEVKGVWQGASYSFREVFKSGITRLSFGDDGTLFVGETKRGWNSIGENREAFERVRWTGVSPFEIKTVKARPDGFSLAFTEPIDRETALDPKNYSVTGFAYHYQSAYGSRPINRIECPILKLECAEDGLSVRLAVACLREGYIHEVKAGGVQSLDDGSYLLHDTAYYTLNRIPDGERILPAGLDETEMCRPVVPESALASTPKRRTAIPDEWGQDQGDRTLLVEALPGLRFDKVELHAIAGEKVELVLRNRDEMLHNFVLCSPGQGQEVGRLSLAMGLEGLEKNYVPESDDVLYHTALLQPGATDKIFFKVPEEPGDYDFICSIPGHAGAMNGILRVTGE